MFRAAGVEDIGALVVAEERAAARREVVQAISDLERRIVQFGDGASVEVLLERAKDFDPEVMRTEESEAEDELRTLDDEIQALSQTLGTLENELERLSTRSAAKASEQAEAELAMVGALARRYARAKLASIVLRTQIEQYREKHQGPILEAANRLFPRLTVGKWSGLEIDYGTDDEPTLVCVRGGSERVPITGLSEGTRDSLFLALRVASLYEFSQHEEPLPLILDDALVHFDDGRVATALTVLSELAQQMQVLFFTHHRRIVELAKATLPADRIALHEL